MFSDELMEQASEILNICRKKGLKLATAESCTGGLISALFTEIAGSSDVFDRGFVTYSNEAKNELLGVPQEMLAEFGAVSEQTAKAMAQGALKNSNASVVIAVTGIAGPGGGSTDKPVGLVHLACQTAGGKSFHEARPFGEIGRHAVRMVTVTRALQIILEQIE